MKNNYSSLLLFLIIGLLLFLIVSNIFLYYQYSINEGFLDTNYEKTIYLIWRNKIKDSNTNSGFGDKLRGAIFLYQYCKENNINLKIDATDDICSDYLKNIKSDNYEVIKNKPILNYKDQDKPQIIQKITDEISNTNTIYVFLNTWPNDLSDDCKEFAKYICKPTDSLKNDIQDKLNNIPDSYGIKHFRFNDDVFKNDLNESDKLFQKYFELLKSDYKESDILITNSNNFKQYSRDNLNIKTIDCDDELCKIEHIGESTNSESVKNSFIEFFIISKAKYIKSHTCYSWPSNFVNWPAKIYDIPFENIYIDEKTL